MTIDKSRSFVTMMRKRYMEKMNRHLDKSGEGIGRQKLIKVKKEALELLESILMHLDKDELKFLMRITTLK